MRIVNKSQTFSFKKPSFAGDIDLLADLIKSSVEHKKSFLMQMTEDQFHTKLLEEKTEHTEQLKKLKQITEDEKFNEILKRYKDKENWIMGNVYARQGALALNYIQKLLYLFPPTIPLAVAAEAPADALSTGICTEMLLSTAPEKFQNNLQFMSAEEKTFFLNYLKAHPNIDKQFKPVFLTR